MTLAKSHRVRTRPRRKVLIGLGGGKVTKCPGSPGTESYPRKQDFQF